MTRIRIDVTGPLNDPTIRTAEIKEIGTSIEDVLKIPVEFLADEAKR